MTKSTTPSSDISIHPSAIVDEGAQIGAGSKVWHWTHVCSGAILGERCSLGQNVYIGNRVTMGNNVRVQNNVSIYDNVTLEDDVFTTIGRYPLIAAGAVVSRDVPDHALMVGVPARRTGWVCQCGVKLPHPPHARHSATVHCPDCHTGYIISSDACRPVDPASEAPAGSSAAAGSQPPDPA